MTDRFPAWPDGQGTIKLYRIRIIPDFNRDKSSFVAAIGLFIIIFIFCVHEFRFATFRTNIFRLMRLVCYHYTKPQLYFRWPEQIWTVNLERIRFLLLPLSYKPSFVSLQGSNLYLLIRSEVLLSIEPCLPAGRYKPSFVRPSELNWIHSPAIYLSERKGGEHVAITLGRISFNGWLRGSNPVLHIHSVILYQIS